MRQIALDTETTGLDYTKGHRVIEIGCVELVNRRLTGRIFHAYVNPGRPIDPEASAIHGLTQGLLRDKPPFMAVLDDLVRFLGSDELLIHNAPFDKGFLDNEFRMAGVSLVFGQDSQITDTLTMARAKHRGQKNDLDSLCNRYNIDRSSRAFHGALLDAEILADVYVAMTTEQTSMFGDANGLVGQPIRSLAGYKAVVIPPSAHELAAHEAFMASIRR